MTKEEIKIETLRLMFAQEVITDLNSVIGVGDYLDKMNGAINRAVMRICQAKKAGLERLDLTLKVQQSNESDADFEARDGYTIDDFDEGINLGTNVLAISRVALKIDGHPLFNNVEYDQIDYKTIRMLVKGTPDGSVFSVFYFPAMVEIPIADDEEIETLRADVQAIIPYFVKSEVYEEDESNLAVQARNYFESMLLSIDMNTQTVQGRVFDVFGGF